MLELQICQMEYELDCRNSHASLKLGEVQVLYTDRERYEAVLLNHRKVHEQAGLLAIS